jgi:hypothetical protein
MAAVTTTIAAGVALAGMGVSAAQAVKAEKNKKAAGQAANQAAQNIANIKETNPFNQVQVPTLGFELAQQGIDRAVMSALSASQGAGAEGVIGGVSNLVGGIKGAELDLAAQANEAAYNRDVAEATAQGGINQRAANRTEDLETLRLQGAQSDMAQQEDNKQAAIQGMFESATAGAGVLAGAQTGAYKQKKVKSKNPTSSGAVNTVSNNPSEWNPQDNPFNNPYYSLGYPTK